MRLQIPPRVRLRTRRDGFRRPHRDDLAAATPAFWSQVDDVIRGLDDVQVVFDDQHRVTGVHQTVQAVEELRLDKSEIESFERDGYLILREFFDAAEVADLRDATAEILRRAKRGEQRSTFKADNIAITRGGEVVSDG